MREPLASGDAGEQEVSLGRLYVIRAAALLGIWGLFPTVETLVDHAAADRGCREDRVAERGQLMFLERSRGDSRGRARRVRFCLANDTRERVHEGSGSALTRS